MRIKLNQMEIIIAIENYVRSKIIGDRQVQIVDTTQEIPDIEVNVQDILSN